MGSLLSGGASRAAANPGMVGLQQPAPLPTPKVTRMPTETDPSILAAAKRTRAAAMQRSGRLSTILTDSMDNGVIGSSGQKLGA
jgi:hypothetical protein